jgi:heme A synthase
VEPFRLRRRYRDRHARSRRDAAAAGAWLATCLFLLAQIPENGRFRHPIFDALGAAVVAVFVAVASWRAWTRETQVSRRQQVILVVVFCASAVGLATVIASTYVLGAAFVVLLAAWLYVDDRLTRPSRPGG